MDDAQRARRLRNEKTFSEINERIADVAEPFAEMAGDSELQIVCECSRLGCTQPITLPVDDYRAARSAPDTFIMLPDHVEPEIDDEVVKREPGYVFARKRM